MKVEYFFLGFIGMLLCFVVVFNLDLIFPGITGTSREYLEVAFTGLGIVLVLVGIFKGGG